MTAIICTAAYLVVYVVDYFFLSWKCLVRPIVTGPIIGLVLGDLTTGVVLGASLEAVFMGISAVGGSLPSDPYPTTIIVVAYAILVGGDNAAETGLALAMPVGTIFGTLKGVFNGLWSSFVPYWERLAQECKPHKFYAIALVVGTLCLLPYAAVIFVSIAFGVDSLQGALAACPAWVMTGLTSAGSMMTAVGFGILLSMIWSGDIAIFFFVGFVLVKSLEMSSLAVAVLGTAVALTYFFIERDIISAKAQHAEGDVAGVKQQLKPANTDEEFF